MSDPIRPTPLQVAAALRMIADLHHQGIGAISRDDRYALRRRELVAFFGISNAAVATIRAGMSDVQIIEAEVMDGSHVLRDVYGKVLTMWVRLSYTLPVLRSVYAAEEEPEPAPVRPAEPTEPGALLIGVATYGAKHRVAA